MTLTEFVTAFETIAPIAYAAFKEPPSNPYMVYFIEEESDFMADNKHYFDKDNGALELYTEIKDEAVEAQIETRFEELHIPYQRVSSAWINTEKLVQTVWYFQIT